MIRPDEPLTWRATLDAHPLLWKAVQLSACAALGTALPDIIDFLRWLI